MVNGYIDSKNYIQTKSVWQLCSLSHYEICPLFSCLGHFFPHIFHSVSLIKTNPLNKSDIFTVWLHCKNIKQTVEIMLCIIQVMFWYHQKLLQTGMFDISKYITVLTFYLWYRLGFSVQWMCFLLTDIWSLPTSWGCFSDDSDVVVDSQTMVYTLIHM